MHGQPHIKFLTYLLTYLLTYSMLQSPSWEANWFAASQEFPRISRNPKVHYRTHKRPPPVSIPDQPNPVRIPTSLLLEIHPNIVVTLNDMYLNFHDMCKGKEILLINSLHFQK